MELVVVPAVSIIDSFSLLFYQYLLSVRKQPPATLGGLLFAVYYLKEVRRWTCTEKPSALPKLSSMETAGGMTVQTAQLGAEDETIPMDRREVFVSGEHCT